jgi:hypothetical protein
MDIPVCDACAEEARSVTSMILSQEEARQMACRVELSDETR